jgi:predicted secreted Zn-dependent protease
MVLGATFSFAHADAARLVYYNIVGSSASELRHQLDSNRPLDKDGKRFDGHTDWRVTWTYRYEPAAEGCRFTEIHATVDGTIVLPRWTDGDHASNSLGRKWQAYAAALRVHEDGHYAHGVAAAKAIEDLGQAFHVPGNCSTIADAFNGRANAIVEQYKGMDATYDADTHHGQTQGAEFP